MRLVAGIASLDLPKLFAKATRRIVLHAALYGPFATSAEHRQSIEHALQRKEFVRLDIIAIKDRGDSNWLSPFLNAVRFGEAKTNVTDEIAKSQNFISTMAGKNPGKVNLYPATALPCSPIVVIDNTIIFGQYAHAKEPAPHGFWAAVEADVPTLFQWAERGHLPPCASKKDVAAYRLISECFYAMNPQSVPLQSV